MRMFATRGAWVRARVRVCVACMVMACLGAPAAGDEPEAPVSSLDWVAVLGGNRSVDRAEGHAIAVDGMGNVFVTGSFEWELFLGPGTDPLIGQNAEDVFVLKMDRDGLVQWARNMDSSWISRGTGIAVDAAGNVFVTGFFEGVTDLDPGPDSMMVSSQGQGRDIFVVKLDAAGDFVWGHAFSSEGTNEARGIALDAQGDVFVTGYFEETMNFDPGPGSFPLTSSIPDSLFILHLDTDGGLKWARAIRAFDASSMEDGSVRGNAIAASEDGRVLITGEFRGRADFQINPDADAPIELTSDTHYLNAFVLALDANGTTAWARQLGGAVEPGELPPSGAFGATGNAIALDAEGNALVAGNYSVYAGAFGAFDLNFRYAFGAFQDFIPNRAMFTCKLDPAGEVLWAQPTPTFSTFDSAFLGDTMKGVAVGLDGSVYSFAYFSILAIPDTSTLDDFEPLQVVAIPNGMLVQVLSADGDFVWADAIRSQAGSNSTGRGNAIAVSSVGHVHTTGWFRGITDFGLGTEERFFESGPDEDGRPTSLFVQKLRVSDEDEAPPMPGDINGDGVVNAVDVQLVINAALGIPIEFASQADVNGDGVVNAVDVQMVINAALGNPAG